MSKFNKLYNKKASLAVLVLLLGVLVFDGLQYYYHVHKLEVKLQQHIDRLNSDLNNLKGL